MLKRIKKIRKQLDKTLAEFLKIKVYDKEIKDLCFGLLKLDNELAKKEKSIKETLKKGEIKK